MIHSASWVLQRSICFACFLGPQVARLRPWGGLTVGSEDLHSSQGHVGAGGPGVQEYGRQSSQPDSARRTRSRPRSMFPEGERGGVELLRETSKYHPNEFILAVAALVWGRPGIHASWHLGSKSDFYGVSHGFLPLSGDPGIWPVHLRVRMSRTSVAS